MVTIMEEKYAQGLYSVPTNANHGMKVRFGNQLVCQWSKLRTMDKATPRWAMKGTQKSRSLLAPPNCCQNFQGRRRCCKSGSQIKEHKAQWHINRVKVEEETFKFITSARRFL